MVKRIGAWAVLVGLTAGAAEGASVYGTAASLTGSRVIAAIGLQSGDPDWSDARLEWTVVNNLNGTFTYTYRLFGLNRPSISHLVLDVTDNALNDPGLAYNGTITDVDGTRAAPIDRPGAGINFTFDGIFGAIKLDIGSEHDDTTYSFTSNRAPVWGDILAKGGQSDLTNTGFGDQTLMDAGHYIARPDGTFDPGPIVPLPMAAWAGLALMGVIGARRTR